MYRENFLRNDDIKRVNEFSCMRCCLKVKWRKLQTKGAGDKRIRRFSSVKAATSKWSGRGHNLMENVIFGSLDWIIDIASQCRGTNPNHCVIRKMRCFCPPVRPSLQSSEKKYPAIVSYTLLTFVLSRQMNVDI